MGESDFGEPLEFRLPDLGVGDGTLIDGDLTDEGFEFGRGRGIRIEEENFSDRQGCRLNRPSRPLVRPHREYHAASGPGGGSLAIGPFCGALLQ